MNCSVAFPLACDGATFGLEPPAGRTFGDVNNAQKIPIEPGDTYTSPEGFLVFTEQYHRKRGYCCTSGCKHCPYGYDKGTGRVRNPKGL